MDFKTKAEQAIIKAAEFWSKAIMRREIQLIPAEQDLMDAVLNYNKITSNILKAPPPSFPKPPKLPSDLVRSLTPTENELKTVRYSDIPTVRLPAEEDDINLDDILRELDREI